MAGTKNGPCEMDCGREVAYPRHGLCSACYSSMRVWIRNKSHAERAERLVRLSLFTRRVEQADAGAIVIGEKTIRRRYRKGRR